MKGTQKKFFSTLLALVVVLSLFAAMPITASAANTNVTSMSTDSVAQLQTKIQTAIYASNSGDTVTVVGENNDQVGTTLNLNLKAGVTVIWKIGYGCPISIGYFQGGRDDNIA